ncbi:HEPN domain-containing protein [Candidatus Woesearchaeota archaeon]|nr:HEPN domain-containing protein [Candidatus Woesearchaeota archaeon]
MEFDKKTYKQEFENALLEGSIRTSDQQFKIKLFLRKAENSLLIANHVKDIKPAKGQPEKLYWNYWAITISYYAMLYAAKAAILTKGYETKNHTAAQTALGHLLVPNQIQKEDLLLLQQAHKIFEDEYVKYFEDARKEAHTARYTAIKTYTEKRLEEIHNNAQKFVAKIALFIQE